MLRATIHGLSAHSVERADRRAQSVDSGNPWIELNEACIRRSCGSFMKGARSRYSRAVLAVHKRLKPVIARACAYRTKNRKYAAYLYKQSTQRLGRTAVIVLCKKLTVTDVSAPRLRVIIRSSSVVRTYP